MDRVRDHGCFRRGRLPGCRFARGAGAFRPRLHRRGRSPSGVLARLAQGELVGARFVTAKELRQGLELSEADPELAKAVG